MKSLKYVNLFGSLIILGIVLIAILQKRMKIKTSQIIETPLPTAGTEPDDTTTNPDDMTPNSDESTTDENDGTVTNTVNSLFILSIVMIGCITMISIFCFAMYFSSPNMDTSTGKLITVLTATACVLCIPGLIGSIIVKNTPFTIVHSVFLGVNVSIASFNLKLEEYRMFDKNIARRN